MKRLALIVLVILHAVIVLAQPHAQPLTNTQLNLSEPLARGCLAYFVFPRGADKYTDSTVNSYEAYYSTTGSPGWKAGPLGDSVDLDNSGGGNNHLYVLNNPRLSPAKITVAVYCYVEGLLNAGTEGQVIEKLTGTTWLSGYNLQIDGTVWKFVVNAGGATSATSADTVNTGEWYYVVGTYDGKTVRLYINGKQNATAAASGNIAVTTGNLNIGGTSTTYTTRFCHDGAITWVGIWDYAMTPGQISQLYHDPYVVFANTAEMMTLAGSAQGGGASLTNYYYVGD